MYHHLVLLACMLLSCTVAAESIYKWVDERGVTHYSESPPPSGAATKSTTLELAPLAAPEGASPAPTATSGSSKKVVIYSTQWCGVCKQAKSYFRQHRVQYTEYDVEKSAKGEADYRRLNGRGVPIILVGTQRMDGFSEERFESMMR